MGIWFLAHKSAIFCPIWMKILIQVHGTKLNLGFGHVEVIRHNWAKKGPNMGYDGWFCTVLRPPQKFDHSF